MREYSHIKSESLAQIRTILAEVKKFFLREIVFTMTLPLSFVSHTICS